MKVRLQLGLFDRWIIVHPDNDELAWSGSQWVPHHRGFPCGWVQISNLGSWFEAKDYAERCGFEVSDDEGQPA